MAKNEVLIRVKTVGGKTVLEAVDNTRKLKSAVDSVNDSQRRGTKSAHAYHDAMNKGVIGTARNARDFSKLSQTIGSGNNGLVGAYATLAANTFAVVAAFAALQRATNAMKIMAGLEAQGARLGQTLSITAGNIRELTDNAISLADAMRSTAQLTAGGFNQGQIQELTKVARDASGALGRDLNDAMDRLTRGVTKLEPELLDELGIMTKLDEASNLYATSLNKSAASLTAAEKRQAFMNAVLAEGQRKFGGIGEQVAEYDSYTRLAAAATDLFNTSMGAVAGVLAPVAEFFADNKGLILGALILYAATIRKDLIPALSEAAARQQDLVTAKGKGLAANAAVFAEQASAIEDAQKKNAANTGKFLPRAGAKELAALVNVAEDGTIAIGDFRRAHKALEAQLENADDILRRSAEHTEEYQIALANRGVLQDAQRQVRGLTSAFYEQQAAQKGLNAVTLASNASFGNYLATIGSIGKELGGQFQDLQKSSRPLEEATTRMGQAQQALGTVGSTIGNTARVAGTGVRAFGVLTLNALPLIGQLTLAVTLLNAAFNYFKDLLTTDEQKEYNKVQEEFNTILDAAANKQAAYNRLVDQAASSSKAQVDALKLRGNAITEITSKYAEMEEARQKAEGSSLFSGMFGGKNTQSNATSDAANRDRVALTDASGSTRQYVENLKVLEAVRGTVNAREQKFIDTQVQVIEGMGDVNDQLAASRNLIKDVGEKYKGLTLAVENVQETFKNLEDSVTGFIQSATISTPVDKIAEDLNKATTAAAELNLELARGSTNIVELGRALVGSLGSQSRNILGSDISIISELDDVQSEVKLLQESYAQLDAQGRARLSEVLVREQEISASLVGSVNERLQATKNLVRQSQQQYRFLKDAQAIEAARFTKIKDLLETGAEGYLAREAHEERVRASQVNQLNVQQTILKIMQTQSEAAIRSLEIKRADLEIEYSRLDAITQTVEQERQGFRFRTNIASQAESQAREQSLKDKQRERIVLQVQQLDISIASAREEMDKLGDSIASLETQKAAILAQNLSAAEKAARAAGAEFEVSKKFLEQVEKYAEALFRTNRLIRDFNDTVTGVQNDTRKQLLDIVETYRDTRRTLLQQLAIKGAELDINENILSAVKNSNSLTKLENDAAERSLSVSEATYNNEYRTTELLIKQADVQMQLNALNLAVYDVRKEGVEWQQRGLEMLEKQADLTAKIRADEVSIQNSRRRVDRIRTGLGETDQSRKNDEVRSATETLRAAKTAASLRYSAIDAEYALLNAQKIALEQELMSRMAILRAMGASEAYLGPIENAVKVLQGIDVNKLADLARKGVRTEIAVAEQTLVEALTEANQKSNLDGTYIGRTIADRIDKAERSRVNSQANEALATQVAEGVGLVFSDSNATGIAQLTQVQEQTLDPIVNIAADVAAIRQHITGGGASFSNITALGNDAQSRGLRVSEAPGFGGVQARHKGRGHAEGRAVDINIGTGNVEANIPDMKAKFDSLAQEYQRKGFIVLWNGVRYAPFQGTSSLSGNPHRDHMHVEMPGVQVDPTVSATAAQSEAMARQGAPIRQGQVSANTVNLERAIPDTSGTLAGAAASMGGATSTVSTLTDEIEVSAPRAAATFNQSLLSMSQSALEFKEDFELAFEPLRVLAEQLGPDGELITAISEGCFGFIQTTADAFQVFSWEQSTFTDRLQASLAVASQVITSISALTSAGSDLRVRSIDAEIAAEQRRDGQSASSQLKLQELEKKKDAIQKKQFNTNKKLMMAQAVIATATGIAQALTYGPIVGPILAALIGAMGAAQIAIISGTSYQGNNSSSQASKITPPKLTIGRVGDKINLDRKNENAGGEIGYLRGTPGYGTSAANYSTIGSAYGGKTNRGYGHRSFLVGEKGPEFIETSEPMNIRPQDNTPIKEGDSFYIQATDAQSFERMLEENPGAIARGLRRVANSSGERFMENVDLRSFSASKR